MSMPVIERRFFLNRYLKGVKEKEEELEELKENGEFGGNNSSSKGTRSRKISGNALKSNFKNGNIPLY